MTSWILTANSGRARIFAMNDLKSPLEEVCDMVNAEANLATAATETDRLGQHAASKSSHSVGAPTQPSGYQPHQSPEQHHAELFARSVADRVLDGFHQGRFEQLTLIASPEFLGLLRRFLDPQLAGLIKYEINKDYTQLNPRELQDFISNRPFAA